MSTFDNLKISTKKLQDLNEKLRPISSEIHCGQLPKFSLYAAV